jgi:hypothetical protein
MEPRTGSSTTPRWNPARLETHGIDSTFLLAREWTAGLRNALAAGNSDQETGGGIDRWSIVAELQMGKGAERKEMVNGEWGMVKRWDHVIPSPLEGEG